MSRNEKISLASTIGIGALILTLVSMASGGAIKCGQINQELVDHGARLDKLEPAVEVVYRLEGKMDIMLEMLKEK